MEHEKLNCYRNLLHLTEELARILPRWRGGSSDLQDQTRRALTSALLNLAEGNGKRKSDRDRQRFFQISMGSLAEAAACLDVAKAFSLLNPITAKNFKDQLRHCYYQIRKLP